MSNTKLVYSRPSEPVPITYVTWKRQRQMEIAFMKLSTKSKRQFFRSLSSDQLTPESYFPHLGFTAGEFVVLQQLLGSRPSRNPSSGV